MKRINKKLLSVGLIVVFLFSGFLCINAFGKTITASDGNINFKMKEVQHNDPIPVQDHTFFDAYIELEGEITETLSVDVYFYFDGVKEQENSVTFEPGGSTTKMASFITAFPNARLHKIKIVVNPNNQHEESDWKDNEWSSFLKAPKPKMLFSSLFEIFELQLFKRIIKLFV
jgi:hypothetical protein